MSTAHGCTPGGSIFTPAVEADSASPPAFKFGESSIANAEAILQAAVNRAIARREPQLKVRSSDVEEAVYLIQGDD